MAEGTVAIVRKAVLQEDEGQPQFVKFCASRKEANDWITAQKGEYHPPSDYEVWGPKP